MGEMCFVVRKQKLKIFINHVARQRAKAFAFLKRQLEHRAAQMFKQNQQMIGIDQRLFGRTPEKVLRVARQELVEGIGGGHQHGQCGRWVSELLPHTAALVDDIALGALILDRAAAAGVGRHLEFP